MCEVVPAGTLCDDGDCCTVVDTCQPCDPATDEGCGAHGMSCWGAVKDCSDDDPCTLDACACSDEDDPYCQHPPAENGTACDYDASDCTVGDTCLGGTCILSEPLPLNDGNPCTVDSCVKGQILHDKLLEGQCDDGDECTTDDHCYLGNCVGGPPVSCVKPPCGSSASCVTGAGCVVEWLPAGAICTDGNACTLGDHCDAGHNCTPTAFQNCEDGDPCTDDACVPGTGCVSILNQEDCPTGPCAAAGGCDDGNPCTNDSCDEATGTCENVPFASPSCMVLANGNNLISFSRLPEPATLASVLGPVEPYVLHLFSEGQFARRLSTGEWRGNLRTLERTRGYWIYMNLPPGMSPYGLHLPGTPTDPDVKYRLHAGTNIVSFAGPGGATTTEAISETHYPLFTGVVGQGLGAFPKDGGWIGSLTKLFPNKGYELTLTDAIAPFQYECPDCDGVDEYVYGCTHPVATNTNPQAEIDDGSCVFDLPDGWATPTWGETKNQAFVIFRDLQVGGQLLEPGDAVAAFIDGECRGVGFPMENETTVPVFGGPAGQPVTFEIYDQSAGTTLELTVAPAIDWSLNAVILAGCMDPGEKNYDPFAQVEPSQVLCD